LANPLFLRAGLATFLAIACALAGVAVSGGRRARFLVPISGALLAAVALFGLVPETAEEIGWLAALAAAAAGYGALVLLDKVGAPVCPSCSHSHGFSAPLVIATAIHAFIDGWGMTAIGSTEAHSASGAILLALLLHKIPEGLALGTILRMSAENPWRAAGWAILSEAPTLAGGALGLGAAQADWVDYPLALAGGAYFFLGTHAVLAWLRPSHVHDQPAN
jgi:zinc transporter ZupT